MRFYTSIMVIFLLFGMGCTQEKELLVADYVVRYLEGTNELSARAKFKVIIKEKSEKEYFPPNGVTLLGEEMELKSGAGITDDYYELQKKTQLVDDLKFKFTHPDGASIEQSVIFNPLKGLRIKESTVKKGEGFTVTWEDGEMTNTEELTIIIDNGREKPLTLTKVGRTKSDSFFVRKEQLSKLGLGAAKVTFLQRRYERYPKEGMVAGSYSLEHYHLMQSIVVE